MHNDSLRGSALSTDDLLKAYRLGYFPMAERHDDPDVFWVLPEYRGVLPIANFHIPRSLKKAVRQDRVDVTVDKAFLDVMLGCAAPTTHREETWINARILETYCALHAQGHAHSVESWYEGELVGGLYGVSIGGAFFGESMFSRVTDASKIALVHLVGRLYAGGYRLLDTQFHTDHLGQFNVVEIPKAEYQILLEDALAVNGDSFALPEKMSGKGILGQF